MSREIGRVEYNPLSRDIRGAAGGGDPDLSLAERASQLDEIRQYLRDQAARLPIVAITATPGGQQVAWIPVESQTADGTIADPPSDDRPVRPDYEQAALPLQFDLQHPSAATGPPGTVPIAYRDLTRIHPAGSLRDFLAKSGRPVRLEQVSEHITVAQPMDDAKHKYAFSGQSVTCYGTEGNINAWDPYTERSDEFSLGQLGLRRDSSQGRQTLEVGHQEYRDLYGDWVPHLFTYYTTNGYSSDGDNKGGYNRDVAGWVQYSGSIFPGTVSSPLSNYGGAQFIMMLKVQLWYGNWWVRVNGQWIGYYPASLYAPDGLRDQSDGVDWWGEVAQAAGRTESTATSMGSGNFPGDGWQWTAYMENLSYQSDTGGGMTRVNAGTWASDPGCYGVEGHFDNQGSWNSYFWWGGPGRNPDCP